MENQDEKLLELQKERKSSINANAIEIKNLSDVITTLMDKEDFLAEDLDKAFAVADEIQEKYEDIIAQLFDLRDRMRT
jgi:hypothetical protein